MVQQSESSCLLRSASEPDLRMACSRVLIETEDVRITLRGAGGVAGISPICWRGGYKLCYCLVLQENGLKLSNSWAGYHILLNPDYGAQVLWRFVNRAIDEVENHQVLLSTAITRADHSMPTYK